MLGHIPTFVIGSALYGIAFALVFFGYVLAHSWPAGRGSQHFRPRSYVRAREHARVVACVGPPDKVEHLLVFVMTALLCYTTSIDSVDVPWLIGLFACLCCAMATQHLLPAMADDFCVRLKPAWYFVEGFLFILTG